MDRPPGKQKEGARNVDEARLTEIAYHQKMNRWVGCLGAIIFVSFAIFYGCRQNLFQAIVFSLLFINVTASLIIGRKIQDLDKLVSLKRSAGGAGFALLAVGLWAGILSEDIYIFMPWMFSYPVAVTLFFGKRIGIYSAMAFTVVGVIAFMGMDLPPWDPSAVQMFRLNALLSLVTITAVSLIGEKFRIRVQNDLLTAQANYKRSEERQRQARQMQAIATLAGGIAHQFNNALSAIYGNVNLIEMEPHADRTVKFTESMRRSADRMRTLTEQLLAYARGGKYLPRTFSINELVREVLDSDRIQVEPSLKVHLNLSQDMVTTSGDVTQIGIVIEAVLSNALESMDANGELTIHTCNHCIPLTDPATSPALPSGRYAHLDIQDNGTGMDEQTRQRIFEPFFTTKFFGRGLGMAAAYGIVQNHGGSITVDSAPGQGTRVHIYLPEDLPADHQERRSKGI